MIENVEYDGEWWLPECPGQKIQGTITFSPEEGAKLHLRGFEKDFKQFLRIFKGKIILGFTTDGKKITLYSLRLMKSHHHLPAEMVEHWLSADYVFMGVHFQKIQDIKFRSIWARFLHLDNWVNISGFGIRMNLKKGGVTVRYRRPRARYAKISRDIKVGIAFRVEYPTLSHPQREAYIKQEARIGIIPSKAKPLEEYFAMIRHIQNFLTLAITEAVCPLCIEGETESNKIVTEKGEIYPPVSILTRLLCVSKRSIAPLPWHMLFSFRDVSRKFGFFLKNWFTRRELLEPVYDLYFGTLYSSSMYLNNEFLNLVQAIESYHRRTMKNCELPKAQHHRRMTGILRGAPNEHREWLEKKLSYSNEPNLRKRLKEILKSCPKSLSQVIGKNARKRNSFVQKIQVTRNYLTHYDRSLEDKAAKDKELLKLTLKLRIMLQSCFLKELGFGAQEIENLVSGLIQNRFLFLT